MKNLTQIPDKSCYLEVVKDCYWLVDKDENIIFSGCDVPIRAPNPIWAEMASPMYKDSKVKFFPIVYLEIGVVGRTQYIK